MQQLDTTSRSHHPNEMVLEVTVPDLYLSAIDICARTDPVRHRPLLDAADSLRRTLLHGRYDHNGAAAAHALRSRVRKHVIENDDVAGEAAAVMDRLERLLSSRGARILGRDPTAVRCTRWWQRRRDWMDDATVLGRFDHPPALTGMIFGPDYVAHIHVVHNGGRS